jgi:hypothetical protein
LVIRSENEELARKVAIFLQSEAGGDLSDDPPQGRVVPRWVSL